MICLSIWENTRIWESPKGFWDWIISESWAQKQKKLLRAVLLYSHLPKRSDETSAGAIWNAIAQTEKFTNVWKLTNTLSTVSQRRNPKGYLKIPWDKWQWRHSTAKHVGYSESSAKMKIYNYKCVHFLKSSQINNLTVDLKELEKEEQTKLKVSR